MLSAPFDKVFDEVNVRPVTPLKAFFGALLARVVVYELLELHLSVQTGRSVWCVALCLPGSICFEYLLLNKVVPLHLLNVTEVIDTSFLLCLRC